MMLDTQRAYSRRFNARASRAIVLGLLVDLALTGVKAVAGVLGNSYALMADAIESALDIMKGLVVLGGLKIAATEPDAKHPYGHGKAEPLAAVVVALGIMGAGLGIAWQSVQQIRSAEPHEAPSPYTLAVLVLVIAVKELLYRRFTRVGQKVGSLVVKADAWHHRGDAITSVAAFIGILVAVAGGHGYEKADNWAALVACVIIAYNGYRLLWPALDEIMDAAPPSSIEEFVRGVAMNVPHVQALDKCLVRKMGFYYFVDLHVEVDGDMSVREGHDVAHEVKDAVLAANPRIRDVLVHIEPAVVH